MNRRTFISLLITAPMTWQAGAAAAPAILRIGRATGSRDQMVSEKMLALIYERLKIPMTTIATPSRRALVEASRGILDGLTHRIFQVGEEYPSLIRVPTPINYVEPTLFSKHPEQFSDLASITNSRVGIRRGSRLAEIATRGMKSVLSATSPRQLMRLLAENRIDVVILSRENGFAAIKELGDTSIRPASRPLNRLPLYHYLHQNHEKLITVLDTAFQQCQKDGELSSWRAAFAEEVIAMPDPAPKLEASPD